MRRLSTYSSRLATCQIAGPETERTSTGRDPRTRKSSIFELRRHARNSRRPLGGETETGAVIRWDFCIGPCEQFRADYFEVGGFEIGLWLDPDPATEIITTLQISLSSQRGTIEKGHFDLCIEATPDSRRPSCCRLICPAHGTDCRAGA